MKKFLILVFYFTIQISVGQDLKALDAEYGFMGLKLETNLDSLENMEPAGKSLGLPAYTKADFPKAWGEYKFHKVKFLFFNKELHSIIVKTYGKETSHGILNLLQLYYGEGKKPNMQATYYWNGKRVKLSYDENLFTGDAEIHWMSYKIQNKYLEFVSGSK